MATYSSILAWRISWPEEPGRWESQRVGQECPKFVDTKLPDNLLSNFQLGVSDFMRLFC